MSSRTFPPVAAVPAVWIDRIGPVEGVKIIAWDMDGPTPGIDEAVYVCVPYLNSPDVWQHLPLATNAQTIQLLSAGYEHALPHLREGVALSNARGVHDAATAEQALALTLAMQRDVWRWVHNHQEQAWTSIGFRPGLADQRVLILGYGSIGTAIARRVTAFEPASISAVASRRRDGDDVVPYVHGVDELPELLPECDVLICALPATQATTGLIGAAELAALPGGSLVVNVGRGSVVDTDALLAECMTGRLRAGLDVTDPEPLPDNHPLWATPGVVVSPHVGGIAIGFWSRATALLRRQLQHVAKAEPLENIVA